MFPDIFGSSGIVKNKSDEKGIGVGVIEVEVPVQFVARFIVVDKIVELVDAAEGVFVGGVAVEKLVLHKAVQRAKFREVAAEDTTAVHLAENACDLTLASEDFAKSIAVLDPKAERFVDEIPVGLDELSKGR